MDHLPYPTHLGVPPIAVYFMPGFEYDHQEFEAFPDRVGFTKNGVLNTDRPCCESAAMAHSWLFFGLIEAYIGEELDKSLLLRKNTAADNDPLIVDTSRLDDMLLASRERLARASHDERCARSSQRAQLLKHASAASASFDLIQDYEPSLAATFLSIKILIIYLVEFSHAIHGWPRDRNLTLQWRVSRRSLPVRLLIDRMRECGWCIHQIMQTFRFHNLVIIYYLSSIPRLDVWGVTHDACTKHQCLAYDTRQDATYEVRHVEEGCRCKLIEAPLEPIINIVGDGGIPLIGIRELQNNQVKLEVTEYAPCTKYIAISHLWADGLGNPTANALPKCQLQKLAGRLSTLSDAASPRTTCLWRKPKANAIPLFWMDTMCIPVDPRHQTLRMKALHRMNLIYASAKKVLVLDQELANFDCESEPPELKHARILSSRWNTRCWTLQEAALADNVLYQFRNSAREVDLYWEQWDQLIFFMQLPHRMLRYIRPTNYEFMSDSKFFNKSSSSKIESFGKAYLRRCFSEKAIQISREHSQSFEVVTETFWYSRKPVIKERRDFSKAWNAVGQRSTTMAEDIHVILANLTDFLAGQMMSLQTPGERTKMMLHCIGKFPLDVLFIKCPRPWANANHADRWIPSAPGPEPLEHKIQLQCTRRGLELCVDLQSRHLLKIFLADGVSTLKRFCFRLSINSTECWALAKCRYVEHDQLPRDPSQTACVIMDMSYCWELSKRYKLRGARLLAIEAREQRPNEMYARYDCPVTFNIQSSPPNTEQLRTYPCLEMTRARPNATLVIEQSRWHLISPWVFPATFNA